MRVAAGAFAALLAACDRPQPAFVASVNGEPVRETEAVAELRSILWRRGESWDRLTADSRMARRREAVENLIDRRLIAQFAGGDAAGRPTVAREAADEFQLFLKQFPPPDEWRLRLEAQGLDEAGLHERIREETMQRHAIDRWLARQPGRVDAAGARAWFDAHRGHLTIPERVRASHIFLTRHDGARPDREPEILDLHRQLTAGEATFAELAANRSDDESAKVRGGDLGWFSRNRVPAEFAARVFDLPVGVLSPPFETRLGWHLVMVREKQAARIATFEETRDEITAMLDAEWRETRVRSLVADLRRRATILRFADRTASISQE